MRQKGVLLGLVEAVHLIDKHHRTRPTWPRCTPRLGLFYRLAPFCFLGGTLVPLGGHNVLEPAALHCAVLAGPHTSSALRAYDAVLQAQGFGCVTSSADIAREAQRLLGDPAAAQAAGDAAARGAAALAGAITRTTAALRTMLDARA